MEIMRFVVLVKLNVVESGIYKEVSVIKNEIFYFIDYSDWNSVKLYINYKKFSIFDIFYYLYIFNVCYRKMIFIILCVGNGFYN